MGRLLVLLEFFSPLLAGSFGFLIGWFLGPFIGSPSLSSGLLGLCVAVLLRFPLKLCLIKTPDSWLALFGQLISYNVIRYLFMTGICYALFFSTGWLQNLGIVFLVIVLIAKYTDAVLFSETERIVSRWANGYFFAGSLTLAGGISHNQPLLIGVGLLLHVLYWYACMLGYSGLLTFYFEGAANHEDSATP